MNLPSQCQASLAIPLYLDARRVQALGVDAHNRLRIHLRDSKATQAIPLHMISRIICPERVAFNHQVVRACVRHGIALTLVGKGSEVSAWLLGTRQREMGAPSLLRTALDDPLFTPLYQDWLTLQSAHISAKVLKACGLRNTAQSRAKPYPNLCNQLSRIHHAPFGAVLDLLATPLLAEWAQCLQQHFADPSLLIHPRSDVKPLHEMGSLLQLYHFIDLQTMPPQALRPIMADPKALRAWAVRYYEKHSAAWQKRFAHLIFDFEQLLRQHWQ